MNLNVLTVNDAASIGDAVKASSKTGSQIAQDGKDRIGGETPQVSADDTYSKLLKLVPVPMLGFYLALENLFLANMSSKPHKVTFFTASPKEVAAWLILVAFVI